jgi:hypothetical protein
MSYRGALITGTVLSTVVTVTWSFTASLTIGPAGPLHLSRNLPADYAALDEAATGNRWELFAVITVIYTLCLLISGCRRQRRQAGDAE